MAKHFSRIKKIELQRFFVPKLGASAGDTGKEIKRTVDFSAVPYKDGDAGMQILIFKHFFGEVVPREAYTVEDRGFFHSRRTRTSPTERGNKKLGLGDGVKFDKKLQAAVEAYQVSNMARIIDYGVAQLNWHRDSSGAHLRLSLTEGERLLEDEYASVEGALQEDTSIGFANEIGRIGEATLAVMHGYNTVYSDNIPSRATYFYDVGYGVSPRRNVGGDILPDPIPQLPEQPSQLYASTHFVQLQAELAIRGTSSEKPSGTAEELMLKAVEELGSPTASSDLDPWEIGGYIFVYVDLPEYTKMNPPTFAPRGPNPDVLTPAEAVEREYYLEKEREALNKVFNYYGKVHTWGPLGGIELSVSEREEMINVWGEVVKETVPITIDQGIEGAVLYSDMDSRYLKSETLIYPPIAFIPVHGRTRPTLDDMTPPGNRPGDVYRIKYKIWKKKMFLGSTPVGAMGVTDAVYKGRLMYEEAVELYDAAAEFLEDPHAATKAITDKMGESIQNAADAIEDKASGMIRYASQNKKIVARNAWKALRKDTAKRRADAKWAKSQEATAKEAKKRESTFLRWPNAVDYEARTLKKKIEAVAAKMEEYHDEIAEWQKPTVKVAKKKIGGGKIYPPLDMKVEAKNLKDIIPAIDSILKKNGFKLRDKFGEKIRIAFYKSIDVEGYYAVPPGSPADTPPVLKGKGQVNGALIKQTPIEFISAPMDNYSQRVEDQFAYNPDKPLAERDPAPGSPGELAGAYKAIWYIPGEEHLVLIDSAGAQWRGAYHRTPDGGTRKGASADDFQYIISKGPSAWTDEDKKIIKNPNLTAQPTGRRQEYDIDDEADRSIAIQLAAESGVDVKDIEFTMPTKGNQPYQTSAEEEKNLVQLVAAHEEYNAIDIKSAKLKYPWNNPRTMAYFMQLNEMYDDINKTSWGTGMTCDEITTPKALPFVMKYTFPQPGIQSRAPDNYGKGEALTGLTKLGATIQKNELKLLSNIKRTSDSVAEKASITAKSKEDIFKIEKGKAYDINDLLPLGDLCTLEDLWHKFLNAFDFKSLLCEYAQCIPDLPWPIDFNWDFDWDFDWPKIPTFDIYIIYPIILATLSEMLIRILCTIITKILDMIKWPNCDELFEAAMYGAESLANSIKEHDNLQEEKITMSTMDPSGTASALDQEYLKLLRAQSSDDMAVQKKLMRSLVDFGIPIERLSDENFTGDTIAGFVEDISQVLTPTELCSLLSGVPLPNTTKYMMEVMRTGHPKLSDFLFSEEKIASYFATLGGLLDPEVCRKLASIPGTIVENNICPDTGTSLRDTLLQGGASPEAIRNAIAIAKADAAKRASAFKLLAKQNPLDAAIGNPLDYSDPNAIISDLPPAFLNQVKTGAKSLFGMTKASFLQEIVGFVPALYDSKTRSLQPGDPEFNQLFRLKAEEAIEIFRLFEGSQHLLAGTTPEKFEAREILYTKFRYELVIYYKQITKSIEARKYTRLHGKEFKIGDWIPDRESGTPKTIIIKDDEGINFEDMSDDEITAKLERFILPDGKLLGWFTLKREDAESDDPHGTPPAVIVAGKSNAPIISALMKSKTTPPGDEEAHDITSNRPVNNKRDIRDIDEAGEGDFTKKLIDDVQRRIVELRNHILTDLEVNHKQRTESVIATDVRKMFLKEEEERREALEELGLQVQQNFQWVRQEPNSFVMRFPIERRHSSQGIEHRHENVHVRPMPHPFHGLRTSIIYNEVPGTRPYFSLTINDNVLIGKRIQHNECDVIPEFVDENGRPITIPVQEGDYIRGESFAFFVRQAIEKHMNKYHEAYPNIGVLEGPRREEAHQNLRDILYNDVYKRASETLFEEVFNQLSDSPIFIKKELSDIDAKIRGKAIIDPATNCLKIEKGLIDFDVFVDEAVQAVVAEYKKPENSLLNIDYTKKGPFEKGMLSALVSLMIDVLLIEFALRGSIAFSTYSAQELFTNKTLQTYLIEFIESSLAKITVVPGVRDIFFEEIKRITSVTRDDLALKEILTTRLNPEASPITTIGGRNTPELIDRVFGTSIGSALTSFTSRLYSTNIVKPHFRFSDGRPEPDARPFVQVIPFVEDIRRKGGFYIESYVRVTGDGAKRDFEGNDIFSEEFREFQSTLRERMEEAIAASLGDDGDGGRGREIAQEIEDRLEELATMEPLAGTEHKGAAFVNPPEEDMLVDEEIEEVVHIDELQEFIDGAYQTSFDEEMCDMVGAVFSEDPQDACYLMPKKSYHFPTRLIRKKRYHLRITRAGSTFNNNRFGHGKFAYAGNGADESEGRIIDITEAPKVEYFSVPGNHCKIRKDYLQADEGTFNNLLRAYGPAAGRPEGQAQTDMQQAISDIPIKEYIENVYLLEKLEINAPGWEDKNGRDILEKFELSIDHTNGKYTQDTLSNHRDKKGYPQTRVQSNDEDEFPKLKRGITMGKVQMFDEDGEPIIPGDALISSIGEVESLIDTNRARIRELEELIVRNEERIEDLNFVEGRRNPENFEWLQVQEASIARHRRDIEEERIAISRRQEDIAEIRAQIAIERQTGKTYPLDRVAEWFSGEYDNLGKLTEEKFQEVLNSGAQMNLRPLPGAPGASGVFEEWTEYVITDDFFVFNHPGESHHHPGEMPNLYASDLDVRARLVGMYDAAGREPDDPLPNSFKGVKIGYHGTFRNIGDEGYITLARPMGHTPTDYEDSDELDANQYATPVRVFVTRVDYKAIVNGEESILDTEIFVNYELPRVLQHSSVPSFSSEITGQSVPISEQRRIALQAGIDALSEEYFSSNGGTPGLEEDMYNTIVRRLLEEEAQRLRADYRRTWPRQALPHIDHFRRQLTPNTEAYQRITEAAEAELRQIDLYNPDSWRDMVSGAGLDASQGPAITISKIYSAAAHIQARQPGPTGWLSAHRDPAQETNLNTSVAKHPGMLINKDRNDWLAAFPNQLRQNGLDSMKEVIEGYLSGWVDRRRYESFWGRTSSPWWLWGGPGYWPASRHKRGWERAGQRQGKGGVTVRAIRYAFPPELSWMATGPGLDDWATSYRYRQRPQLNNSVRIFPDPWGKDGIPDNIECLPWEDVMEPYKSDKTISFDLVHNAPELEKEAPGLDSEEIIYADGRNAQNLDDIERAVFLWNRDARKDTVSASQFFGEFASLSGPGPRFGFVLFAKASAMQVLIRGEHAEREFWSRMTALGTPKEEGEPEGIFEELKVRLQEEMTGRLRYLFDNTNYKLGMRLVYVLPENSRNEITGTNIWPNRFREGRLTAFEERTWMLDYQDTEDSENTYTSAYCVPLMSYEENFDLDCLGFKKATEAFYAKQPQLRESLVSSKEFEMLTKITFPLERFTTLASVYSTIALSSRSELDNLLKGTKASIARIMYAMQNRPPFGDVVKNIDAADLSHVVMSHLTPGGPSLPEHLLGDFSDFIETLIINAAKTPLYMVRSLGITLDPAMKDMKKKTMDCKVRSVDWGGITSTGLDGRLTDGVNENAEYAPVSTAFPLDLMRGIRPWPPFLTSDFFEALYKFSNFLIKDKTSSTPKGRAQALAMERLQGKIKDRYGTFLGPFGLMALGMPYMPGEKDAYEKQGCIFGTDEPPEPPTYCPDGSEET